MEVTIKTVNYGYIVNVPKISDRPYVFKATEEFKMIEFVAKQIIEMNVKVEQR